MSELLPIIRKGDTTTHQGVVLEGFEGFNCYGKPASGLGHKVSCPRCKGTYVIAEGVQSRTVDGTPLTVEGMKTSCGAQLIASQTLACIEAAGVAAPGAGSQRSDGDTFSAGDGSVGPDEVIEQWMAMEDESGRPVIGYKYDLFKNAVGHAYSAHFNGSGETIRVAGDNDLRTTIWLDHDLAERS